MRRFLIITATGKPLVNDTGNAILFRSEAQAQRWKRPGEQILPASDSLVGEPAIEDDFERD